MSDDVLTIEQAAARFGIDPERLAQRLATPVARPALRVLTGSRNRHVDGRHAVSDACRADLERRYFTWCRKSRLEPTPMHGDTPTEVTAMRERFKTSRGSR